MSALSKIFLAAGAIIPAAGRQGHKMLAKEIFEESRGYVRTANSAPPFTKGDIKDIDCALIMSHLKDAGYDTETDKPYNEVLKLQGGKQEFNAIYAPPAL
ncbi:MAG TPA: hypothetical protein VIF12_05025 [Micavibrio sp.]|jgi:hypothetical protein